MPVLAPDRNLWKPDRQLWVPSHRGKPVTRRVMPQRRSRPLLLNMAGERLLDFDTGKRLLGDGGKRQLVNTADPADCTCCGGVTPCTACAAACTVSIFELKSNYPEACAEFWDISGGCPGTLIGTGSNIERGGNLDSETFNLTPTTPVSAGVTCAWNYTAGSAWTIDVYESAGCTGSFCTIDMISVDVLGYGSLGSPTSYEVIVTLFKSGVASPSQSTIFDTGFSTFGGIHGLIEPPDCPSGPTCNYYCFSVAADNSLVGHDACGHPSPSQLLSCDAGGIDIGEYDGGFCVLTLYNP